MSTMLAEIGRSLESSQRQIERDVAGQFPAAQPPDHNVADMSVTWNPEIQDTMTLAAPHIEQSQEAAPHRRGCCFDEIVSVSNDPASNPRPDSWPFGGVHGGTEDGCDEKGTHRWACELALVGYDLLVRPRMLDWSATFEERRWPLPGDDVVTDAVPARAARHTRAR